MRIKAESDLFVWRDGEFTSARPLQSKVTCHAEEPSTNPLQIDRTARIILDLLSTKELNNVTPNAFQGMADLNSNYPSWDDYFARRSIYNAFAVEYLVDSPTGPLSLITDESIQAVYSDSNVTIYRDLYAMPRAYLINSVRPVNSFERTLSLMLNSKFDPHDQALVEAFPYELPPDLVKGSNGSPTRLKIDYFGSTRIEIALHESRSGLAVLADAYYPGWRAEVDGHPRKIFIVNGILRGVLIEPEDKLLTFYYSSNRLSVLLVLAIGSFLLSIIWMVLPTKLSHKLFNELT